MKKFYFSLSPLLKVKKIHLSQKRLEFSAACQELEQLYLKNSLLEAELERSNGEYTEVMKSRAVLSRMALYDHYTSYLKSEIGTLEQMIFIASQKKETLREQLAGLTRETDTLERLKKEQYRAYLDELNKFEEKALDDLMAYNQSLNLHETAGMPETAEEM